MPVRWDSAVQTGTQIPGHWNRHQVRQTLLDIASYVYLVISLAIDKALEFVHAYLLTEVGLSEYFINNLQLA